MKKIKDKIGTGLISFSVSALVVLLFFIFSGFAPFGNLDILTASGRGQLFTCIIDFHNHIFKDAGIQPDFTGSLFSDYIFMKYNPLVNLLALFPVTSIASLVNIIYLLIVGFAAVSFNKFISLRNKRLNITEPHIDQLSICLSVAYAVSSYSLSFAMNIIYTAALAILPMLIAGIEDVIYKKSYLRYIVSLSLTFFFSFPMAFVFIVLSFFYLMLCSFEDKRHVLTTVWTLILLIIISVGIGIIPVWNIFSLSDSGKYYSFYFYISGLMANPIDAIKQFFAGNVPVNLDDKANGISVYSSIFAGIVLFFSLFNGSFSLKDKFKNILFFAIIIFATFDHTLNYIFSGFLFLEDNQSIFSIMIIFYALALGYSVFQKIKDVKRVFLLPVAILSIAVVVAVMIFCTNYTGTGSFLVTMELIILYSILIFIYLSSDKKYIITLIAAAVCIEVVYSGYTAFSKYKSEGQDYASSIYNYIYNAAVLIKKNDESANILLKDNLDDVEPVSASLRGLDYIIDITTPEQEYPLFEKVYDEYNLRIYHNPYAQKNGIVVPASIVDYQYDIHYPFRSINMLASELNMDSEIYSSVNGEVKNSSTAKNTFDFSFDEKGDIYINIFSHIYHIGEHEPHTSVPVSFYTSKKDSVILSGEYGMLNHDVFTDFINSLNAPSVEGNVLKLNTDGEGYLLYPYTDKAGNLSVKNLQTIELFDTTMLLIPASQSSIAISNSSSNVMPIILTAVFLILAGCIIIKKVEIKINSKIASFYERNYLYIISTLLSVVVFLLMMFYSRCLPFGENTAIVSDGYGQYYPLATGAFNDIRNHNFSLLNYHFGYAADNYVLTSSWLLNPINWLLMLFPNIRSLNAFTFIYFVEFIMISPAMTFYILHSPRLSKVEKSDNLILACTLAYSIATYNIAYFTFFLHNSIFLPLVLLAFENLFYKKKTVPYILFMAYFMASLNYSAFLICEFLVLYFFMLEFDNIKDFFAKGIRFAWTSILAAGLAMAALLPFFLFTQNSPYKETTVDFTNWLGNTLLASLQDFQFITKTTPVSDDFTMANLYCGMALLILLPLYFINKKVKLSVRIKTILVILLLYYSLGNEILNFIFHGFHVQSMVPNRFSIFITFMMIICFYTTITSFKDYTNKSIIISTLACSVLFVVSMIFNSEKPDVSNISTIIIIVLDLAVIGAAMIKNKKEVLYRVLSVLLIIELMFNAVYVSKSCIGSNHSTGERALELTKKLADNYDLGSDKLTKSETVGYYSYNSASTVDTYSITYFSSVTTVQQTYLSHFFSIPYGANVLKFELGNPLANVMLGVKNIFTDAYNEYVEVPDYYDEVERLYNVTLFKDSNYVEPGILMKNSYNFDKDRTFETGIEKHNYVTKCITGKDLYNIVPVEKFESDSYDDLNEDKDYLITTKNGSAVDAKVYISKETEGYIYIFQGNKIYYLGKSIAGEFSEFELSIALVESDENYLDNLTIGRLDMDAYNTLKTELSKTHLENKVYDFSSIKADYNAPEDGTLFLPLPYYDTWEITVDGNVIKPVYYMGGLGIPVTAGEHKIILKYHTPGLKAGAMGTLVSIVILILYILFTKKKKTPKNEVFIEN